MMLMWDMVRLARGVIHKSSMRIRSMPSRRSSTSAAQSESAADGDETDEAITVGVWRKQATGRSGSGGATREEVADEDRAVAQAAAFSSWGRLAGAGAGCGRGCGCCWWWAGGMVWVVGGDVDGGEKRRGTFERDRRQVEVFRSGERWAYSGRWAREGQRRRVECRHA